MISTAPLSRINSLQFVSKSLSTNPTGTSLGYSTMAGAIIWVLDNYTTIQKAINNATPGDTIFVRAGIYSENITLNKTVTLIGEYKWATFIFEAEFWCRRITRSSRILILQSVKVEILKCHSYRLILSEFYEGIHFS
jgi:hypothetical protein